MAVPMFVVNGHDYAKLITELKPSRNDVDSDGSGRNLLDAACDNAQVVGHV